MMFMMFRPQTIFVVVLSVAVVGCVASAQTNTQTVNNQTINSQAANRQSNVQTNVAVNQGATPTAGQNAAAKTPSTVVREFYQNLRDRRFREAMMMTNLRAAVETLSAQELDELRPDFEPLAAQTPDKIEISGETISGSAASVLVKIPGSETSEAGIDEIRLRREGSDWLVLSGDAATEERAKRDGKQYFFNLRVDVRHANVQETFQDIVKAQLAYGLQHNSEHTDLQTLVREKLLGADLINPYTSGYNYRLSLAGNRKSFVIYAEPVQYGRTGKLSFALDSADKKSGGFRVQSADNKGQAVNLKR